MTKKILFDKKGLFELLRAILSSPRYPQKFYATALDVKQPYISNIVSGKIKEENVKLETILKYLDILGYDCQYQIKVVKNTRRAKELVEDVKEALKNGN